MIGDFVVFLAAGLIVFLVAAYLDHRAVTMVKHKLHMHIHNGVRTKME